MGVRTKVSVCIVTYNNEDKIVKLLSNLVNVLEGNISYRIFVVDNGSSDSTVRKVRLISGENKNVNLFQERNLGFGAGHNIVLNYINSEYHFVINPDIIVPSFSEIQKMVSFLDDNPNVGLLSPLILNKDKTIQRLYKKEPTVLDLFIRFLSPKFMKQRQLKFVQIESGYNKIGLIDYASGSFMVFRTNIFKMIKGFDTRYFMYMEDADITRKVRMISKAVFYPKAYVIHEWQRASHKKLKYTLLSIQSLFKYFNKWGWKFF